MITQGIGRSAAAAAAIVLGLTAPAAAQDGPALDGVQRSLAAAAAHLPCAVLAFERTGAGINVSGAVAGEPARAHALSELGPLIAGIPGRLDLRALPARLCGALIVLHPLRLANAGQGAALAVEPVARILRAGDPLVVDVTAPGFAAHLRVDYITADGTVVHLLPNPSQTDGRIEAGGKRRLGERGQGNRFWSVGPPFGDELIIAIASPEPLFTTPRPEAEPAAAYLADLARALDGVKRPGTVATVAPLVTGP